MICPRCQQSVMQLSEGLCPYCGYPYAEFRRRIVVVQALVGAIFASTLIYGAVVAVLELAAHYRPHLAGVPEHLLGAVLLLAAVGPVLVLWKVGGELLASGGVQQAQRGLVLMAAGSELPAVNGLLAYLLSGSVMWFALLLGVSWLCFLRLGLALPAYLSSLRDQIGRD